MTALFQHLPIHTSETITGDHERRVRRTVFCPHGPHSREVHDCKECPFAREVNEMEVTCVRGGGPSNPATIRYDPRADIAPAASRTLLYDVVDKNVACLRSDASVDVAVALMIDRDVPCLPVVDDESKLVGIVSKTDVLAHRDEDDVTDDGTVVDQGFHVEPIPTRTIADIMTPCVHALPEDAPIGFAISLMAFENLGEVPVVDREGRVVGLITARDTMRWIAERLGYVLARPSKPRSAETSSSTLTGLVK